MAYRNKTFVSFDGDNDIRYYRLMRAWKEHPNIPFNFFDAHDINTARDTSTEETIKRRLRERMQNARVFVLLVGGRTKFLYRFVRWEIEHALSLELPIVGVNLNGSKQMDSSLCPAILRDKLAIHVSFTRAILQYALQHWPDRHRELLANGNIGPRYYKDSVYESLSTA